MKLRNLLFGTMIACAFVGCSNDDDPINKPDVTPEGEEATFSLKIEAPISTRSGNTTGADNTVASLAVYVFNGTGTTATFEAKGTLATGTNGTIESKDIAVHAGRKSVVVVANTTLASNPATLGTLYNATKTFSDEKNGQLSMNSKTYVVDIIAGTTNYLGYTTDEAADGHYLVPTSGDLTGDPVKLYRNVAKINLASVSVNTTEAENLYPNAKFILSDVFVLHAKNTTKVVGGADAWNSTEVSDEFTWLNGVINNTYSDWVTTMTNWIGEDNNKTPKKSYLSEGYTANVEALAKASDVLKSEITILNNAEYPTTGENTSIDYFYAYENTSTATHTLLVIKGKFVYGETNADGTDFPERYYSISVGRDKVTAINPPTGGITRDEIGVLRNVQYNIALTVKGPGWETPFGPDGGENTALDVKVEVVDFSSVNQEVGIE